MKKQASSASQTRAYGFEDGARRIGVSSVHLRLLNRKIDVLVSETKQGEPITVFGEQTQFTHDKPNKDLKPGEWQLEVKHGSSHCQYYTCVELPEGVLAEVKAQLGQKATGADYGSR